MGHGHGVSGGSGVGLVGLLRLGTSLAQRHCGSVAGCFRSRNRGCRLCGSVVRISLCRVRRVASKLFVLRSEFVFVYAAARLYGADVSASRPAAEVVVWMLARIALCLPGAGGSRGGIVAVGKAKSRRGMGGGRDHGVLLLVQCILLLVEGGADVWAAVRGSLHSTIMPGAWGGLDPSLHTVALGFDNVGGLQHVYHTDGGVDVVAAGNAG